MSVGSEENLLTLDTGGSFWEPGNYRRSTKRIDDGHRLCDDLVRMVSERAEIEKSYAKSLKAWSKKWFDTIDKGPEYGSTESAWKSALVEADRRCELHLQVRDNLLNDVQSKVKQWQKDNYHRYMMQFKEKRDIDDAFKKAQKPWIKLLTKVNKAKHDYHSACKHQRTVSVQERNATGDDSLSSEAMKKLNDRVLKAKDEVSRTKGRYEAALRDLGDYNGQYVEDMRSVFERCQQMEMCRLEFVRQSLLALQKCLNISADDTLSQIYSEFDETIMAADKDNDLMWWSNNHGVNMPMNWPSFEDYSEEFRDISSGRNKKDVIGDGTITLIHQRTVCDDLPDYNTVTRLTSTNTTSNLPHNQQQQHHQQRSRSQSRDSTCSPPRLNNKHLKNITSTHINNNKSNSGDNNNMNHSSRLGLGSTGSTNVRQMSGDSAIPSISNSDDTATDDCWDDEDHQRHLAAENSSSCGGDSIDGSSGVAVRALYDYTAAEDDELTFVAGQNLYKLGEPDDQGWCQGRLNGRLGLYPANYVQPI